MARSLGETDSRVRCLRRIGRRGLAGACLEGMLASQARYVAVMDADLQHDATLLAPMLEQLRSGSFDLVVASRHFDGGSAASLSARRARISRWSNTLAQRLLGITLTDPMSGYFMLRREALEELAPSLSSEGFQNPARYSWRPAATACAPSSSPPRLAIRHYGESKLDSKIALDFAALITAKLTTTPCRCAVSCCSAWLGSRASPSIWRALRALLAVTLIVRRGARPSPRSPLLRGISS